MKNLVKLFCIILCTTAFVLPVDNKEDDWDIAALDTARDVAYMSTIEKDVILEMNKVRTNPKRYAEMYIESELKYYNNKFYERPGQIRILTSEGKAAVEECIRELIAAEAVGILEPLKCLALAAQDHRKNQGATTQVGHTGVDRSTVRTRMERHCKASGAWALAENISYGPTTARDIVVQLLIDDGVPNRGHRINIMNGNFTQTGVGFGAHKKYNHMCVIVYGRNLVNKK